MSEETCPSFGVLSGYWIRRHELRSGRESRPAEKSFEDLLAVWISLALWTALTYYGITLTKLAWYWPVAAGIVSGFASYKLLSGPLRVRLSDLKHSDLFIAIVGAAVMFALQTG